MVHAVPTENRTRHRFTVDDYETMIKLGILTENHPVELIRGEVVIKNAVSLPYRFTLDEYERMIQRGILAEKDRVELIRGEIVEKMSIGDRHIACVNRLNRILSRKIGDSAIISIQNPIQAGSSEPEPDVAALRNRDDFYASRKAQAEDIFLVIEVADSSIEDDREIKGPIYAESSISEYWIVNLNDSCLEVFRSPQGDGTFADTQIFQRDQQIEIQAFPGIVFNVGDFF